MRTTLTIDPVTRIEGHFEIQVTIDSVGGQLQVVDARASGKMFRGFEVILIGRDPRDAAQYTQRICGVCPVSHGLASSLNLESAFGVTVPNNGRILRNLVLASNYIQSHLLHFYHLSVLDYVNTTTWLDVPPWTPRFVTADMLAGGAASTLIDHYKTALHMRRKAHQMGAVFGGKLPCPASFVAGGCTAEVTTERIAAFRALLTELRGFIDNTYLADAEALATAFADYYQLGVGCGNLLAFGVFDLDGTGSNKLLPRGRYTGGNITSVDPAQITEYVTYSWYTSASGNKHPAQGVTEPDADKAGAYSWLKAPRYAGQPHELGPLARMWMSGDYRRGISALDRIVARAHETKKVADAMNGWLDELAPGAPVFSSSAVPTQGQGVGLTEAPRGGLGHWMDIAGGVIARYQVVTPTTWNASPRDELGQLGPIEAALMGTPVADASQPVEVLRVIHSFDPCLACAVHVLRPGERSQPATVVMQPGVL